MRYTDVMPDPFIQGMARNFHDALHMMETAVAACPDALWTADLWPGEAPTAPAPHGGLHGSAPWFLAYHALTCLDYDLAGEFEPWAPPKPFDDNTWSYPNRVFTKAELSGYIDYCRERAREVLAALSEEAAARPLPERHRYHGTPYGEMISGIPLHIAEHAAQIRQFVADTGVSGQP